MSSKCLHYSPKLESISIINTKIRTKLDVSKSLSIKIIDTEDFMLCCLSLNAECTAIMPWYISCSNLLPNKAIRVAFYIVSSVTVSVNILSISLQVISYRKGFNKHGAFGLFVTSINVIDFSCGFYILILWIADLIYKNNFFMNNLTWRSSLTCFTAFFISINFTWQSPLLLCFLSFSRLMVVKNPFDSNFKKSSYVLKCILCFFILSVLISALLTTIIRIQHSHLPMSLCSPFIDPTDKLTMIKVLTWFSTIIQIIAILFIIIVYISLVRSLRMMKGKIKEAILEQKSNRSLIIQLMVVTFSNILCWIPSGTIYLTSMFLDKYPIKMLIWTTITLTTINSIINPLVFVVTTFRKFK